LYYLEYFDIMEIYWKDKKTRDLFESEQALLHAGFDKKEAKKAVYAISSISAVKSINQLPKNLCCHPIKKGKKFLYFTVDVPSVGGGRGKHRIRFIPVGDECDLSDLTTITKVEILGIEKH
jgi:hypothetical protein